MSSEETWYKRVWSWMPFPSYNDQASEDVRDTISLRPLTIDSSLEEGFALRKRNSWSRKEIKKRKNSGSRISRMSNFRSRTETNSTFSIKRNSCKDCKRISTQSLSQSNMFDLHHKWKNDDIDSQIKNLPDEQRLVFEASLTGCNDLIKDLLAIENPSRIVNSKDSRGRTPLHDACSMGHLRVVTWLLESGADPNAVDKSNSITPLMCAAVSGSLPIMSLLLENGAWIDYGLDRSIIKISDSIDSLSNDEDVHSALVWAVRANNFEAVKYLLDRGASIAGSTVNKETPLHEAAYLGSYEILQILICHHPHRQYFDLKGGPKQSTPLHIAVEEGHTKCVDVLLSHGADPDCENADGKTPLHIAASIGDEEAVLQLITQGKANVNSTDSEGRSPLHYCIPLHSKRRGLGSPDTSECAEILLRHGADNNLQDSVGCTPFHLAMLEKSVLMAPILLRAGADLTKKTKSGQSGLELLLKEMPHAMRYVRDSLDLSIDSVDKDVWDPYCSVTLNFRGIVPTSDRKVPAILEFHKEMEFLCSVCKNGYKEILSHPLVETFLLLKWRKVRKYFWASFISNMLMVITYSVFVIMVYKFMCPIEVLCPNEGGSMTNTGNRTFTVNLCGNVETWKYRLVMVTFIWTILMVMVIIFWIKEMLQMVQDPISYAKHFENYIQILFVVTAIITAKPSLILNFYPDFGNSCLCKDLNCWEYRLAAIGVLTSWILVLLRFGKMPRLGLYVQMLIKVILNFGLFMCAYASILIAFGLAFSILLGSKPEFESIQDSIHTVLVMMTGEIQDFRTKDESNQPIVTFIMLTLFVLVVTLVLMNLLVGLAVSDIQGLHKGAKVARLSRLVIAISQLESILFSKGFVKVAPDCLRIRMQGNALVVPTDSKAMLKIRPHDPHDTLLPVALALEAVQIIENRRSRKLTKPLHEEAILDTNERIRNIETTLESIADRINLCHNSNCGASPDCKANTGCHSPPGSRRNDLLNISSK